MSYHCDLDTTYSNLVQSKLKKWQPNRTSDLIKMQLESKLLGNKNELVQLETLCHVTYVHLWKYIYGVNLSDKEVLMNWNLAESES